MGIWEPIYLTDGFTPEPGEAFSPDAGSSDVRRSRDRVLVVDDQKLIADTIREILVDAGFEVQAAYDGKTALEIANRFHPDVLLADILMPFMNGVQLAISFRRSYPETKAFLFSGQAGIAEILRESRQQGFEFELIAKPIHPDKLIEKLRNDK